MPAAILSYFKTDGKHLDVIHDLFVVMPDFWLGEQPCRPVDTHLPFSAKTAIEGMEIQLAAKSPIAGSLSNLIGSYGEYSWLRKLKQTLARLRECSILTKT